MKQVEFWMLPATLVLAFSQICDASDKTQLKQAGSSQEELLDYETTQLQDKDFHVQSELKQEDSAPDIKLTPLTDFELGSPIQLSSLYKEKPLVMLMGSCTCGLTKDNAPQLEKLYKEYGDRAHFAFVYMKDAHPSPTEWVVVDGKQVQLAQPKSLSHRIDLAKHLIRETGLTLPIYVDDIERLGEEGLHGLSPRCIRHQH